MQKRHYRRLSSPVYAIVVIMVTWGTVPVAAQDPSSNESLHQPERFGFGSPATPDRIAAWDIDVMPDGTGLPPGQGSVSAGREIYAARCSQCHGACGTEGPEDVLVGRLAAGSFPFADTLGVRKTIGNYWPYAPTLFDYIRRAMPFDRPGSLTDEEVYSVTAFLLHLNGLISEESIMNAQTLRRVEMPARDRFVPDDRLEHTKVH